MKADSVNKQSLRFPELRVSSVCLKETESIFKKAGVDVVNTADPRESTGAQAVLPHFAEAVAKQQPREDWEERNT